MSILDEIEKICNEESPRLFLLEPSSRNLRASSVPVEERRKIYISREIKGFLESDDPLAEDTQVDLERFILGHLIVVALQRDHKKCRMARLNRPNDEVWEMRIYEANPQLRLFGRFACRDIFVALIGPEDRNFLEEEDFEEIKRDCKAEWNRLFVNLNHRPVVGSNIYDYISEPVRLV
jgi:hypothetical protein